MRFTCETRGRPRAGAANSKQRRHMLLRMASVDRCVTDAFGYQSESTVSQVCTVCAEISKFVGTNVLTCVAAALQVLCIAAQGFSIYTI